MMMSHAAIDEERTGIQLFVFIVAVVLQEGSSLFLFIVSIFVGVTSGDCLLLANVCLYGMSPSEYLS